MASDLIVDGVDVCVFVSLGVEGDGGGGYFWCHDGRKRVVGRETEIRSLWCAT